MSIFVGMPATGKSQATEAAEGLLLDLGNKQPVHLAAHNFTKASMLDQLSTSMQYLDPDPDTIRAGILDTPMDELSQEEEVRLLEQQRATVYHHLDIFNSEFGTMTGQYSPDMLSTLSTLYDARPFFVEQKRGFGHGKDKGKPLVIVNPSVSMLTGTQPQYLTEHLPLTAFQQGFATRLWFEYVPVAPKRTLDIFGEYEGDSKLWQAMVRELERISQLSGEMFFTEEAKDWIRDFYLVKDRETAPDHSILKGGFNDRRLLKLQKYAALLALGRYSDLRITLAEIEEIYGWMISAENRLITLFEVMGTSSDAEILRSIWEFIQRRFTAHMLGTPISDVKLFIAKRGDVHKAPKYLEQLEDMGAIELAHGRIGTIVNKAHKVFKPVQGFKWK